MIKVVIHDRERRCPTAWGEVTVAQFFKLLAWQRGHSHDFIKLVAILTGAPYRDVATSRQLDLDELLAPELDWLSKPMQSQAPVHPKTVTIPMSDGRAGGVRHVDVPQDLDHCTFAQKIRLQERIAALPKGDDGTDLFPFACAVYLQPVVTGQEFSTEAALAFEREVVATMSATEAWGAAAFFLKTLSASRSGTSTSPAGRTLTRCWRALTSWTSSRSLRPSMPWQAVTSSATTRSSSSRTPWYSRSSSSRRSSASTGSATPRS